VRTHLVDETIKHFGKIDVLVRERQSYLNHLSSPYATSFPGEQRGSWKFRWHSR
jgi:hypothetical protein